MVFCNTYFTEAAIELDASSVYRKYGTVAQFWLERWPVTPEVFFAGSSPVSVAVQEAVSPFRGLDYFH